VYPQGLRKLLKWIDKRYDHMPIYIFENGVSVPGETQLPIAEAVHDDFRTEYYKGYINAMEEAIKEDGVDVRGYFAWSLMDNFEWADGYNVRFGMVYVDYADQTRYIKDSAFWYSDWVKSHPVSTKTIAKVAPVEAVSAPGFLAVSN
jgi:beta-glucosidase